MRPHHTRTATLLAAAIFASSASSSDFQHGPPKGDFFPIAVWLQSPHNAARFKEIGINTYVGLWRGPTEDQLSVLKNAEMKLICAQNTIGLAHQDDPMIIGWMQDDEPDNARSLGQGKGYGPPILPEKVIARYEEIRAKDSTRPVLLNLGQGVAWDNYIGRGVRRNHPEDYAQYVKGGDIVSFDIYPATHDTAEIKGRLEYVGKGVQRLRDWAGPDRMAWNCIEAKLGDGEGKVSPEQLRSEVWMSLINGSRGIIYFVHQFKPVFREASLFEDAQLTDAVRKVNAEIQQFASLLNSPNVDGAVKMSSKPEDATVAAVVKRMGDDLYLFSVGMSARTNTTTFSLNLASDFHAEAIGESRPLTATGKSFSDTFAPYQVHLYRLKE